MLRAEKPHVLVADDNEATCTLIAALLQREFEVHFACDGQEAIEKLRTRHFAVALLDLRMPQADGFDVLVHLRDAAPTFLRRVLVVTASLTPTDLTRARSFSVGGIITKPFEIEELLAAVQRCARLDEQSNDGPSLGNVLYAGGPMILLLADLLHRRLL
jgi:Response regulator containing CheY-like receiver, AAA-type ATPase, and DNA-binding domains